MKTLIATIAIVTMIGLIAIACDPSPTTPPTAPTRSTPVLQPTPIPPTPVPPTPASHRVEIGLGGSVELPDLGIGISFDRVLEDSRCPANVVCISAGQVVIDATVTKADTSAVVRLTFVPGKGAYSPWTRVPISQQGLEGISIRLTGLVDNPGSEADQEGGVLTVVLEVMVDPG